MKPVPAIREYHYWSERLVTKLWQDNVSQLPNKIRLSAGISNLGIQAERQDSPQTRAARAVDIEALLADHLVEDLDYMGPTQYLAGRSYLVMSSLRNPNGTDTGAVTLFASLRSEQGRRIAVCLFGSANNVCGFEPTVPMWRQFGWTSSSTNGVEFLLRAAANGENSKDPDAFWHEAAEEEDTDDAEICWTALQLCSQQGTYFGNDSRPWRRGYTIGYYHDVEWVAQIYFSLDALDAPEPVDVIHVGAAFWVRSGSPRAFVPYNTNNVEKLDVAERQLLARPLVRIWNQWRGNYPFYNRKSYWHPRQLNSAHNLTVRHYCGTL